MQSLSTTATFFGVGEHRLFYVVARVLTNIFQVIGKIPIFCHDNCYRGLYGCVERLNEDARQFQWNPIYIEPLNANMFPRY